MQTLIAIWNNAILLFFNRLSTYKRLICSLLHVSCISLQVSFSSLPIPPPSLSHPSRIKRTPRIQTCTSFCLREELCELEWLWSLKRQSFYTIPPCNSAFTFTLPMLKSEDSDICQTSTANRLKFKLIMQTFGESQGHVCCMSYTIFHMRKRCWDNRHALTHQRNNKLVAQRIAPFSLLYYSASVCQSR